MNVDYTAKLQKIESTLHAFLPQAITDAWSLNIFGNLPDSVGKTHIGNLTEPCRDLLHRGGKRWRPLMLILCAEAAAENSGNPRQNTESAYALTPLVEFVHTASLIHDDIEDSAETRRGKPAVHISYGADTALNAGSWLYFLAASCISGAAVPEYLKTILYELYAEELRRLHLGQAMDIAWHKDNSFLPDTEEYLAMIRLKTGALASLAARTGILVGSGDAEQAEKAGNIAADIGMAFQILDDAANLTSGNPGKKRGDDIVEGKKSFPVLLHIQKHPSDMGALTDCFIRARAEGIDSPAVEECIGIIAQSSAISDAKTRALDMIRGSCGELRSLFPNGGEAAELLVSLFTQILPKG